MTIIEFISLLIFGFFAIFPIAFSLVFLIVSYSLYIFKPIPEVRSHAKNRR